MLHSNKKSIALVTKTALHTVLTLLPLLIQFFFFLNMRQLQSISFQYVLGQFKNKVLQ